MTDILSTDSADLAVIVAARAVGVQRGSVGLDFTRVPYGTATLDIPMADPSIIAATDPRKQLRMLITTGDRTFDLSVRSSRAAQSSRSRMITVDAATDEAILQAYAPLTDDVTPFALSGSLRELVRYVIRTAAPEGFFAAGPDADVTPRWAVTNLLRNPAVAGNTLNWSAVGCTIAYEPQANPTSGYVKVTTTASPAFVYAVDTTKNNLNASPGETYTWSIRTRMLAGTMNARLRLRFLDANGGVITDQAGPVEALTTQARQITMSYRAPANAVRVVPFFWASSPTAGQQVLLDGGLLHTADPRFPVVPFTGLDSADAAYSYRFEGDSNDSPSVRTPLQDRDPESLVWGAGVSAWDFLEPLCASVGLRLFCNEQRRWFLIDPAEYVIPFTLTIDASTLVEIDDTTRVDDPDTYATGVLVRYRWEDRNGVRMERHDTAGVPGVVRVIDLERPFPGAGVAQRVLDRMRGRGRVHEATVVADTRARPGMTAILTAPGTPTKTALVRAVEWGLTNGRMRVRLTDPPTPGV